MTIEELAIRAALYLPITFLQAFWLVVVVTWFLSMILGELVQNNSTPIEQRGQGGGVAGCFTGLMVWGIGWFIGGLVFLYLFIW